MDALESSEKVKKQSLVEVNSELSIAEIPSHGDGYDSWMLSDSEKNKTCQPEAEVVKVIKKNEHLKKPTYIEVLKK